MPKSFVGANLANAIFRDANLAGSIFDEAELAGADFSDANLTDCSFLGAKHVMQAKFKGAILTGAKFSPGVDVDALTR